MPVSIKPFLPAEVERWRAPIPPEDYLTDPSSKRLAHRAYELFRLIGRGHRRFNGLRLRAAYFGEGKVADCSFDECDFAESMFYRSTFRNCTFVDTSLTQVRMNNALFERCVFDAAVMSDASVVGTKFVECTFVRTDLSGSAFDVSELVDVDLSHTRLSSARFVNCNIADGRADGCHLSRAIFAATPVDTFCRSGDIDAGTDGFTFDWQTVTTSLRSPKLEAFLSLSRAPEVFVLYMINCARAVDPHMLFKLMRSTFISYGTPDVDFARELQEALQRGGVKTFFFEKDAIPGAKLHDVMRDGVNDYDRVILICSEASLERPGVLTEIEQTLAREARDGGASYLLPLTLDDYVFTWHPTKLRIAQDVRDRVVADFRGTQGDPSRFAEALHRLLRALAL